MPQKVAGVEVVLSANSTRLLTELERSRKEVTKLRKATENSATRIKYAFNKIRRAAQVVASAFIVKAAIQSFGRLAAGIENAQERVVLLQARMKQFARSGDAFARIYSLSQELGVSLDVTAEGMTRLLIATREMGSTAEEIENVQKNIVLLGRAGGTSAEEMRAALIQLTQGMASGRLQGEELRSVLENLPLVAMEIARQLDTNIGQLREFGKEGRISGEVVVAALQDVEIKVEDLPETFSMAVSRMKTEWGLFAAQLGEQINTEGFLNALSETMAAYRQTYFDDLSTVPTEDLKRAFATTADLELMKSINAELQKRKKTQEAINVREEVRLELMLEEIDLLKLPKRKDSALASFVGQFKTIEDRIVAARKWLALFKNDIINIYDEDKFNQIAADIEKIGGELKEIDLNALPRMRANTAKSFKAMTEYSKQAARNMQDAFADFLFDPFDEGLSGMLKNFLDTIRRMLANQLAVSFFENTGIGKFISSIGKRAMGGPVSAGTPYLVGERGPEIFAPSMSGSIIPNNKMGGVTNHYHFEAGVDIATLRAEVIPMMELTQQATLAEVYQQRHEGKL